MPSREFVCFTVIALAIGVGSVAGCGAQEVTLQPEAQGPTLSGLTLLNDRCTEYHTLDRVRGASKTREGWQETGTDMVQRGRT